MVIFTLGLARLEAAVAVVLNFVAFAAAAAAAVFFFTAAARGAESGAASTSPPAPPRFDFVGPARPAPPAARRPRPSAGLIPFLDTKHAAGSIVRAAAAFQIYHGFRAPLGIAAGRAA